MGKLTIDDTPEQLGCCLTADAIMIDGKIVTREDVRRLQSERDALAATVEALKNTVSELKAMPEPRTSVERREEEALWRKLNRICDTTPQQHLAEIRAEAGRAGFIAGYSKGWNDFDDVNGFRREPLADQYAERVKAGDK